MPSLCQHRSVVAKVRRAHGLTQVWLLRQVALPCAHLLQEGRAARALRVCVMVMHAREGGEMVMAMGWGVGEAWAGAGTGRGLAKAPA